LAPNAAFDSVAVSSWAVHTAVSSYSGSTCNAGTCAWAPQPLPPWVTVAPTIPTRIFVAISSNVISLPRHLTHPCARGVPSSRKGQTDSYSSSHLHHQPWPTGLVDQAVQ